ncbi:Rv3235 family protein [Actinocorallia longicatena]|uniref:Uncharacterized protein n=1 Tax=Actinocorallia longicatena TaxID=111803 RepID=A0ABP6QQH5_9ACTN
MPRSRVLRLVSADEVQADLEAVPTASGSPTFGSLALRLEPAPGSARGTPPGPPDDDLPAAADRILWITAEIFAGRRAFRQLAALSTAELAEVLQRQEQPAIPTRPGPPRIRNRRIQRPGDGVAEVTATVIIGGRIQPIAVRLVLLRGRWRCAALETAIPS